MSKPPPPWELPILPNSLSLQKKSVQLNPDKPQSCYQKLILCNLSMISIILIQRWTLLVYDPCSPDKILVALSMTRLLGYHIIATLCTRYRFSVSGDLSKSTNPLGNSQYLLSICNRLVSKSTHGKPPPFYAFGVSVCSKEVSPLISGIPPFTF